MNKAPQKAGRAKSPRIASTGRSAATRSLTMEIAITFSERVASLDHQILEGVLDGLMALDEQELLFPGLSWPPLSERLLDVNAEIKGVGWLAHDPRLAAIREREPKLRPAELTVTPLSLAENKRLSSELSGIERELENKSREVLAALALVWRAQECLMDAPGETDDPALPGEAVSVAFASALQVLGKAASRT